MAVQPVQSSGSFLGANSATASSTSGSSADNASGIGDMNSFLTMFLTQLKSQDPTNPMESYELSAQLAQFSTVEKMTQANTLLQQLQNYSASLNNVAMASMVGKEVSAIKSDLEVGASTVGNLDYKLDSAAGVTIKIYDQSSNLVQTIEKGNQAAGKYKVDWDGTNAAGNRVAQGTYTCKIAAVDATGNQSEVSPTVQGSVYAFKVENGSPFLVLNNETGPKISAGDVIGVAGGSGSAG